MISLIGWMVTIFGGWLFITSLALIAEKYRNQGIISGVCITLIGLMMVAI